MDNFERDISSSTFKSGYAENVYGSQIGTQINYQQFKHFIKRPIGLLLAILLILLLSGSTFVIGKASVNHNNCLFTANCSQKIDSGLRSNYSTSESDLSSYKESEKTNVVKDYSFEAAAGVGILALGFWLFILFLI